MPRAVDLADAARRIARIALVDDTPMFLRVFCRQSAGRGTLVLDPNQALASLQRDDPPDACVLVWTVSGCCARVLVQSAPVPLRSAAEAGQ
jgi:hypothetical protein